MNDKKKTNNLINMKYKIPFVIGVFLLVVFLIFTILKQTGMFAPIDTSTGHPIPKSIGDIFCIERVWNESTRLVFTLRNCGDTDITPENFTGTTYYIDNVKTLCTYDNTYETFNAQEIRTIRCPAGSYGVCTELGCPIRVIQVKTAYGKKDTTTYQYQPA